MASSSCHLCGIYPGRTYPEILSVLPFPVSPAILSFPICTNCLAQKHGSNTTHIGRVSLLPEFSVEFEISASQKQRGRALALLPCGYLRTPDVTVSDEYKSPIYHSLDAFRMHLPLLDTLSDLVTNECGTHIHVAFPTSHKAWLRDFQEEIFGPLIHHWFTHRDETERFWGRNMCYYASDSLLDPYPCIRTRGRYATIEFRLPRFRTAAQYVDVVRFCRRITYFLHRSIAAFPGKYAGVQSSHQIGHDLLVHYRTTLERQAFYQQRREQRLSQWQQFALLPMRINDFLQKLLPLPLGS